MTLFLITFLTLYSMMHLYVFTRLRNTFSPKSPTNLLLAVLMCLMVLTPLLVRIAEASGRERIALWLAWPGYVWMGGVFLFTSFLLALDVIRLALQAAARLRGQKTARFLHGATTCKIALLVALLASSQALYEARHIRSEHVTVRTHKLSPGVTGVRIVQLSDVHIGLLFRETRLQEVIEAVNAARADILVSTGDLVDGRLAREDLTGEQNRLALMLTRTHHPSGAFAITGNHEYYAGLDQALAFTSRAGFTLLRNRTIELANGLAITGIDDQAGVRMGIAPTGTPEPQLLQSVNKERFNLLLKHRPDITPESDGNFDLQLSGHIHQGQLFPFNLLVRLQYPIQCGTTETIKKSLIHVSRGTGTWGPPMRFLAPPEITVIDLVPA